MKSEILLLSFLMFFFFPTLKLHSQNPVFPKPDRTENIPFGSTLPVPKELMTLKKAGMDSTKRSSGLTAMEEFKLKFTHAEKPVHSFPDLNMNDQHTVIVQPKNFHLTRDINKENPGSNPHNFSFTYQPSFAEMDKVCYFNADDGLHGYELWRSDGSEKGTFLVKDINPGVASGSASSIVAANENLFFSAYTESSGWAPWISDGTAEGTKMIMTIPSNIYHSYAEQFVKVGKMVFFTTNSDHGNALWRTDGTENGTHMIYDFNEYFEWAGYINQATSAGNLLFFTAWTPASGRELWRSDGTTEGTFMVKDVGPDLGDYFAPMQLTSFDHRLYYSGDDGSGRNLWQSDGTSEGTHQVANPENVFTQNDYLNYSDNVPFAVMNDALFFSGFTYAMGNGLYKIGSKSESKIELVKDLWPGWEYPFISPPDLKRVGNALYFKVISPIGGYHDELWMYKDKSSTAKIIRQFSPSQVSTVYNNINGTLFFVVDEPSTGPELWTSNGTYSGTHLVKDINKGSKGSYPYFMTSLNGKLLLSATDRMSGAELWVSDGTEKNTYSVKNINHALTYGSNPAEETHSIAPLGERSVMFAAFDPLKGRELYISDGSYKGTHLVKDIIKDETGSYPNAFVPVSHHLFFRANNENYSLGFPGSTIWKSDGTLKETKPVVEVSNGYFLSYNVSEKGLVFYAVYNIFNYEYELWRSDGTTEGTFPICKQLFYNPNVVIVGKKAFFVAGDYTNGYELWTSDGTVAGTKLVKDINPGFYGSYPYSLFEWKDRLYFAAYDGTYNNYSFWISDGTAEGTQKLRNITPAYFDQSSTVKYFEGSGHNLFLSATDYNAYPYQGSQLWKTDGSSVGTKIVKQINVFYDANPYNLKDVDGNLYFTANDGIHGIELWKSDGTSYGTNLVSDLLPELDNSNLSNFCSIGDVLYFLKDAGSSNAVLWFSDENGTTAPVAASGLEGLTNLQSLVSVGDKLFLSAVDTKYGAELFEGEMQPRHPSFHALNTENQLPTLGLAEEQQVSFQVALYPNPVSGPSLLVIKGCAPETLVKVAHSNGTVIWQFKYAGNSDVKLPSQNWDSGIYLITVISGDEKKTIKMVKQ